MKQLYSLLFTVYMFTDILLASSQNQSLINFSKQTIDFGNIYRGQKIVLKFPFTNDGNESLKIKGVHSGCGCAAVNVDTDRIYPPKSQDEIIVEFDSTNFAGSIIKTISVITNGKKNHHSLTIKGQVSEEFSVYPPVLNFGSFTAGQLKTLETNITPKSIENLDISISSLNADIFDVKLQKNAKQWNIRVTIKDSTASGFISETIWLKSNSKHLPEIPLPIRANIIGNISYKPDYTEFGMIQPGETISKSILLSSQREFKIENLENKLFVNGRQITDVDKYLVIENSASQNLSKSSQIKLTMKNLGDQLGSVHGKLKIQTNDLKQSEIIIDYYAFFAGVARAQK